MSVTYWFVKSSAHFLIEFLFFFSFEINLLSVTSFENIFFHSEITMR